MDQPRVLRFRITGLDCAEEVSILRRVVGPAVGGEQRLSFDVLTGSMIVHATGQPLDVATIVAAVAATGMQAEYWPERGQAATATAATAAIRGVRWTVISGSFLVSGLFVLAAAAGGFLPSGLAEQCEQLLWALSIASGLRLVVPKAARALARRQADMNVLMTVAVTGAVLLGQFLEGASVAFLFALSNALEAWSVRRAQRAISQLLDLAPPTARTRDAGGVESVRTIEEVTVDSRIIVRPGERIPLDGVVVAGASQVNQAPITGESVPVERQAGDPVFAGTINGGGALEIRTTRPAGETTVARIVRLIDTAQARRAPSEQWVERFARVYTPVVMGLALAIFVGPPLVAGAGWADWFYRSLVLLVIACPCALVISTPVSIVAALAAAARNGVLVKGGQHLEMLGRLRAIAFDKTGTLTAGCPRVQRVIPFSGHDDRELLERAAALECRSTHPLAEAIVAHAQAQGIVVRPAEDYQELAGQGAEGRYDGDRYWIGSLRMLRRQGYDQPAMLTQIDELAATGHSVVVIGNQHHVCGLVALADTARTTAADALEQLRAAGVERIVLLTGDTQATARAIGDELGIREVRSDLLPPEKVQAIEQLARECSVVAMVGDGINDAPALARATVGIAMGCAASDVAIEAADVALMSNDLTRVPWAIHLSRRAVRIVQANIASALAVKVLFVLLTVFGHATLWAAIAADMGTSLLVILNGLRLLTGVPTDDSRGRGPGQVSTSVTS